MLNYVLRATLATAVCAIAVSLSSRTDATMVSNPASVMTAAAAANFAQPEQVRGLKEPRVSCNLRIPCPPMSTRYGGAHSRALGRYYYESCRCDFGSNNRECVPITSCYAEGGRCRGSCAPQSGFFPSPPY
jgi:hypothetical protein